MHVNKRQRFQRWPERVFEEDGALYRVLEFFQITERALLVVAIKNIKSRAVPIFSNDFLVHETVVQNNLNILGESVTPKKASTVCPKLRNLESANLIANGITTQPAKPLTKCSHTATN